MGIIAAKRLLWKDIEKQKGTNKEFAKEFAEFWKDAGVSGAEVREAVI